MKSVNLTSDDRQQIKNLLRDFVDTFGTQSKAAARLDNCSEATLIHILNDKWENVSEKMWLNVASQVGFRKKASINIVETLAFQTLILYFTIAKEEGAFFSLVSAGGRGKTIAGEYFEAANRNNNVYKITCETFFNKKIFLQQLLKQLGKKSIGLSHSQMMELAVSTLRGKQEPLLIIDQVGKLPVPVLLFFIALYNMLEGQCGVVWTSANDIVKTIEKGLRRNAPGFQELSSRFGNRHIAIPDADEQEVRLLCHERGITKEEDIMSLFNSFEGDMRTIDRFHLKNKAHKILLRHKKAA